MLYLDFRPPVSWSEEQCDEELRRESLRIFKVQPVSFGWARAEKDTPRIRQAEIKGFEHTADGGIARCIE